MFVVSVISEGILLQLTDHLLFGQSDPASFALRQPFNRDYFTLLADWPALPLVSVTICVIMNGPEESESEPEQSTI